MKLIITKLMGCQHNMIFFTKPSEHKLIGRRIKLIHTDDQYTKLKSGDLGTITDINIDEYLYVIQIGIKWDQGSNLMMIGGKDEFEIL